MDFIHDILHTLINHFIPHEGNDYRPHLLQKAAFVGLFGMVVLTFALANFHALLWQSSKWLVGAVLPAVVIDLTNEQRVENNLATLVHNPVLDAAAKLKAEDMANNSYFSHNSPTGVTPWHWFEAAGYSYVYAGENLAVYFTDSSAVVDAWMKSPTHRANIVGTQYREIGVGTAKGKYNGYDTVYVVQLFGTPALPPAAPAVSTAPAVRAPAPLPRPKAAPVAVGIASSTRETPQVAGVATTTPTTTEVTAVTTAERDTPEEASTTVVTAAEPTEVEPVAAVPVSEPEPVVTTTVANDVIVLNLDMATSATGLIPAPILSVSSQLNSRTPAYARLATEPHHTLQFVYLIIGCLTSLALFASVLLSWRQHRPMQTAYGILLLLCMCGLFYVHTVLTTGVTIM